MGCTLEDVAKATGFSMGYLSKLERSDKIPPYATLQSLSDVFCVSVNDLLEEYNPEKDITRSENGNDIVIVKSQLDIDDIKAGYLSDQDGSSIEHRISLIPLTRDYRNRYMAPFLMSIPPGTTSVYNHDAEEFNFVLRGPVVFKYNGTEYRLNSGDSFYFDSRKDHSLTNECDYNALVIATFYSYRKF